MVKSLEEENAKCIDAFVSGDFLDRLAVFTETIRLGTSKYNIRYLIVNCSSVANIFRYNSEVFGSVQICVTHNVVTQK